jgi:capsular polysaccharide biosynthesis protein
MEPGGKGRPNVPYGEYFAVLRRRWWLLPLVALVAAGSAFIFARAQTPLYRSTSKLLVTPGRPDLGQQFAVEKQLRPIAQRVRTTEVARLVDEAERLDLGPDRLLGMIRAEAIIDQGHVQIDADDTDPERAERIAGAFAQVFAQQHAAADVGKPLTDRLNLEVLDRPSAATQVWPQTRVLVLAAALIGLLGGILLAFGLNYLDDTLKTNEDVERLLGLSTLARVPRWSAEPTAEGARLASVSPRGEQRVS